MNAINHKVASGETVLDISKKYGVDPAEIYRANRFAIDGIKEDMVLQFYAPQKPSEIEISTENYKTKPETVSAEIIPEKSIEQPIAVAPISAKVTNRGYHTVQKGETLYGLSKMYNVTVDDIKNSNTILMKNSLQAG
ncbi:MAG TPA: LysM peptidoglycan-binding domain-containing protein, partial [Flavobacterium sp.]|nr:LysM peptidoglycan-binding domain-containing protein [Flavobacterium sp.]